MRVLEVLEEGVADGTHIGAQVYVSRHGEVLVDAALGEARVGVPMTTDTMMTWFSMTKAVTALAVAQQWERGALEVDAPVARYLPEFGAKGKEAVTIEQVLTHTAGFPFAPLGYPKMLSRETRLESMAKWRLDWEPGSRLQFHLTAAAWVVAELIERNVARASESV